MTSDLTRVDAFLLVAENKVGNEVENAHDRGHDTARYDYPPHWET